MKNKPYKQFLAFLLCAAMLSTYMPSTAFTFVDEGSDEQQTVEEAKPAAPAAEKKVEKKEEKKEEAKAEKAPAPAAEEKVEAPAPEPKAEEPAETPKEEPAEKPEASGDETRAGPDETEPVEETADEPAVEAGDEAVEETAEEPAEETAEEALEEAGEEAVDEEALEEEEEEGDEEDAEKEEEEKFPAFSKTATFGGVTVIINAPEGALPEGVRAEIVPVGAGSVEGAVEDMMGANTRVVTAFDITFFDKKGEKFDPKENVSVRFVSEKIDAAENPSVLHIKDNGTAEKADNGKVSDNTASFKSTDFSVYVVVEIVVPRLTVEFKSYDGASTIASMIIKDADTEAEVKDIIYDPGAGTLSDGAVFKGWSTTASYTTDTELLTIAQIRSAAMTKADSITEDETVTYYAAAFKNYTITYQSDDENPITVGTAAKEYPAYESDGYEVSYPVSMGYTVDSSHNFMGWVPTDSTKANSKNYPTDAASEEITTEEGPKTINYYPNNSNITITGDITFTVLAPEGAWLVFDETCGGAVKGATYTAPQFVLKGEVTKEPSTISSMTCNGYEFGGWYDTAEHAKAHAADPDVTEGAFQFGDILETGTTIYASWIPHTNAAYTVIFWTQNQGRTGYEVAGSYAAEDGVVGEYIPYTVVDNGAEDYVTGFGDNNGHYTGFCLTEDSKNQQVTVTPEGDAVLNLYYDRILYNFRFYLYRDSNQNNRYDYANNSGNGSSLNDLVTWHVNQTEHPTVDGYTVSSEDGYHYFTIQAYYGQDISGVWPTYDKIHGANGREAVSYVMMVGTKLKPNPTNQGSGTVKGLVTVMNENILGATNDENGNYVVVRFPDNYYNWRYHIWFETADDETYPEGSTRTYNGKTYYQIEDSPLIVRSSNTTDANQNEPKYTGFDFNRQLGENFTDTGHWTTTEGQGPGATTLYHLNYLYDRQQYEISYFDGSYFDGDNNLIQNRSSHLLHESEEKIGQGITIADKYRNYEPALPSSEEGYVFEGWYLDEGCTTKYVWDTMPVGGIQVYAKWRQVQYRVFLHTGLTAIDDTKLTWGSENQKLSFRVDYNGTVSTPTGIREGYKFLGWYTADGTSWTDSTKLNDSTVKDSYDKDANPTDPETKDDNGTSWYGPWDVSTSGAYNSDSGRSWVTKKLDLYAKWSKALPDADGINVVYNAKGIDIAGDPVTGSNPPTDDSTYIDNSRVTASSATTAPDGYVFDHWVVCTYADGSYTPKSGAENELLPGETFTISADDAKVEGTGDTKTYTVQLMAVYKETEEETPTHIYWYKNDGTNEKYREDDPIQINKGVKIYGLGDGESIPSRTGYTFKGWAKSADAATPWIAWDSTNGYTYNGASATLVAADQKPQIEDLYALWETATYDITVTKTFDGIDALPSDFKITYTDGKETPVYSGTLLPSAVSVEDKTYTWTIEDVAYETALTFTESGYEKDSYSVTAEAKATVGETTTTGTYSVTMTVGEENKVEFTNTYVEQNPELTIEKKADTKSFSNVGDVITWTITATNSGDVTLNNVEVTDKLTGVTLTVASSSDVEAVISGLKATAEKLEPNQSLVLTASYTVTQKDIDAGKVGNSVSAKSDEDTPDDPPTSDIPADQKKDLDISKTPITESYKEVGEEISWKITAENKGNVTLNNVEVTDKLNGVTLTVDESSDATPTIDGAKATIAKLGPGRKIVLIATYTVTQADIDAGKVSNAVSAKSDEDTPDDPPPSDIPADQNKALKVTKTANPSSDVDSGDVITYTVVVENTGNVKITGIKLTDSLVTLSEEAFNLEPGAKKTVTYTYTVTDADVTARKVTNTATATGKDPKGEDVTGSMTVNTPTKQPQPEPPVPGTPKLEVKKTSDVAEGTKVKLGDVINYKVTVKNVGEVDLTGITVEDSLVPIEGTPFDLAIGATKEFNYSYTVTQADVDKGSVINHATAKGGGTEDDDEVEVPTEDPKPELTVTKTASPSSGAKEGTTIKYTIVVENTGNVTVSNINISDSLVNVNVAPFTLAPGEKKTIKYSYKVTAADVEAGSVKNAATATGTDPSGETTPPGTDEVTVTTEEDDDDDDTPTPTPTPTPPAPAGPAGPAPGGPGVVPAAPVVDGTPIADEPVPEAEPEVEIPDEPAPLAEGTWALLNLIAAILTTLGAIVALFRKKEEEDEDEDEEDQNRPKTDEEEEDEDDNRGKKMLAAKIAGAVAGVVSPIVFFLTEDMSLPMALIDKWTLLMAVFLIAQIAAAIFNKKASELDDEEEEEAEPAN